jgi:putative ABC transport system permease protein
VIRFLVRLYPRDFRERYGGELLQFHRARMRDNPSLLARIGIVADHLISASALRLQHPASSLRLPAVLLSSDEDSMNLRQDIHYAIRSLAKRPAFAAVVILTIALGVGANSAIFSVVNGVLLKPLPYPHADRLVFFGHQPPQWLISDEQYLFYRDNLRTVEFFAAYTKNEGNLATNAEPERVNIAATTLDFFKTLGVSPMLGRTFAPDENLVRPATVAIISYGLWQRHFGADPHIIGSTINVEGVPRTVVGVMPASFEYPNTETSIWLPLRRFYPDSLGGWGNHYLFGVARLKPGVTPERAQSEANTLARRIMADHPDVFDAKGAPLTPKVNALRDELVGKTRPYLVALLGAVGFVLLIVCANVANLLLARGEGRRREMAVRTALGASHRRLVAQLITESLVLALAGGILGLGIAWAGCRALVAIAPDTLPRLEEVRVDWIVVSFSFAVSLIAGLIFGLFPAVRSSLQPPASNLMGGRTPAQQAGAHRVRSALVVAEVALAMIMLTGAGMLLRSLVNLQRAEMGFDRRSVLTAQVSPNLRTYDDARVARFYQDLLPRLRAIPGVRSAGAAFWLPVVGVGGLWGIEVEGKSYPPGQGPDAVPQTITPGYFAAMGERVNGRDFTDGDVAGAPLVAIVNQSFAKAIWPNEDALGRRFKLGGRDSSWMTVVGIAPDIRMRGFDDKPEPMMYWPHAQAVKGSYFVPRSMGLVIRTAGEPTSITHQVRAIVHDLDPQIPVSSVRTLEQIVGTSVANRRFSTSLIAGFAALAMLLAAIGIYGVISYMVSERTFEIGVRMALGAEKGSVLALVLRDGVRLALIGIAIGVAGAAGLSRAIRSMLVGVPTIDVVTMLAVAVVLASVAVLASLLPARRATAVSPTEALRGG